MRTFHAAQDPLDLRGEAHVGQPVGLVEDERADLPEADGAALDEVDETSRCGHDDVDRAPEGGDLLVHRAAAVHHLDARLAQRGERCEDGLDLEGELAGRHQDEGTREAGTAAAGALEQREAEGQGLARSRLGLAAHVAAVERVGDAQRLDGEWMGDVAGPESGDEVGRHAERVERHGHW